MEEAPPTVPRLNVSVQIITSHRLHPVPVIQMSYPASADVPGLAFMFSVNEDVADGSSEEMAGWDVL